MPGATSGSATSTGMTAVTGPWGDTLAVDLANELNMTHKQFSDWLESHYGHYFGAAVFGGLNHKQAEDDARRWQLVRIVKPAPPRSTPRLTKRSPVALVGFSRQHSPVQRQHF